MKIENMRYIIEVSKYKSINKASQSLFMNQRQLSRIIAMTEEELDMQIFERTPKGIVVTDEGREIIKKFEVIVDAYESLQHMNESSKERNLSGKIAFFSDVSIWDGTIQMHEKFMLNYPKIGFSLESMSSEHILYKLQEQDGFGKICRVIREDEPDLQIASSLNYRSISRDRLEVYGRPENPAFRQYKTISLHTLLEHPLVVYRPYSSDENSVVDRIFESVGKPMIRYEVADFRVFWTIVSETDCLFLTIKRPSYLPLKHLIGIPVRDNVQLEYGTLYHASNKREIYEAFDQFHLNYYKKLQES